MKTIKILAAVAMMSVGVASANDQNHNKPNHQPNNCFTWPKFDCHNKPPCHTDCHHSCPPCHGGNGGTTNPNPGTGGGNPGPGLDPIRSFQYRLEVEYKPGYGFSMYVRNIGTYRTRAEAEVAAAPYVAQNLAYRIIEVPNRPVPGTIRPINTGDLRLIGR